MITILALPILFMKVRARQPGWMANPCSDCRDCSIGVSDTTKVAKKALLGYVVMVLMLCTPEERETISE
jgi:hypothetical protein